jgi:hypothetical protein
LSADSRCVGPSGAGAVPAAGHSPDDGLGHIVLIAVGLTDRVRSHTKHRAHHAIPTLYRLRKR